MKRSTFLMGFCILICCGLVDKIFSNIHSQRRFHTGFSAGLGLPKVSFSKFRTPVSVIGGGMLNYRMNTKTILQIDGYGLKTFSLGTVNDQGGELRFNLLWTSLCALRHVRGIIERESFILIGMGGYHLSQQFDEAETILYTMGLSLGFADWKYGKRWNRVLEIRWHILFQPSSNPQVLTITFGFML